MLNYVSRLNSGLTVVAASLGFTGPAMSQAGSVETRGECAPSWTEGVSVGYQGLQNGDGINSFPIALLEFDDGSGPALYAGGNFEEAGPAEVSAIGRWNGDRWESLPGGPEVGEVTCMAVFDPGSGPALYFAGAFRMPGENNDRLMIAWDGSQWQFPDLTTNNVDIQAMEVFDDGTGPALYLGGTFYFSPTNQVHLMRFDGMDATIVENGPDGIVYDMVAADELGGPALYVGGNFDNAGGAPADAVARWDGSAWNAVGDGFAGSSPNSLAMFDHGEGPALYAVADSHLKRLEGNAWVDVGPSYSGSVQDMRVFDDGSGLSLWLGGGFNMAALGASDVVRWDGSEMFAMPHPIHAVVYSFGVFDDGRGPRLHLSGTLSSGNNGHNISLWEPGFGWTILGRGVNATVRALGPWSDGGDDLLFVGGDFTQVDNRPLAGIASWDGFEWKALAGGGIGGSVRDIIAFDDGSGAALFVTGTFEAAGSVAAKSIAKWDGAAWSALGTGLNIYGRTLAVHDDGSGPALYAGGFFSSAGGQSAKNIAKWDGDSWSPLGLGLNNEVLALASFDDGSGPALFAGGQFLDAGGQFASRVAKWQNGTWHVVGLGLSGPVDALLVFNDGSGPALYAGGNFIGHVARWDGSSWEVVGGGANGRVHALSVIDDGSGPALFAGGSFTMIGGEAAERLAKWDGASWEPVAEMGLNGPVYALAPWSSDGAPSVFAGGAFTTAGGVASEFVAEYRGCEPPPCVGDIDGDGFVGFADLNIILSAFNTNGLGLPGDVDGDGDVDFADLNAVVSVFNTSCAG